MNTNPLADFPGFTLKRVSHSLVSKLQSDLGNLGVKLTEASLLTIINANSGITSAEAGRMLSIAGANMAPLCTRLKARELVRSMPVDGKSQGLYLTKKGKLLVKKVVTVMTAHENYIADHIPEHLRESFCEALEHLSKSG